MTNAERLRGYRAKAKAAGLCIGCRLRTPREGVLTCEVCLAAHYAHRKRGRPMTREEKDARNTRVRAERQNRVQNGACARCGGTPAETGRACCHECLEQQADAQRAWHLKRRSTPPREVRCTVCDGVGHNARRHRRGQP